MSDKSKVKTLAEARSEIERLEGDNASLQTKIDTQASEQETALAEAKDSVPASAQEQIDDLNAQVSSLTEERDAAQKSVNDINATLAEAGIQAEEGKDLTAEQVNKGIEAKASAQAQQICSQQGIDFELSTHPQAKPGDSTDNSNKTAAEVWGKQFTN